MTNLRDRDLRNRELRRENQAIRDNNSAASGLMLGIILTSLIGLGLGALFLFNQRTDNPAPTNQQTIIERTREVPAAQPQAPDVNINVPQPEAPPAPDVNLTLPNPAPQQAPTTNTAPADTTAPAPEAAPAQGE